MDLRLRSRDVDGVTIVEVGGELDLHSAPQLRGELARVCGLADARALVDLSGLSFIDSTGIGVLVGALKLARERGGQLLFVCPLPRIRRVFEIAGLLRALPLYSSREEALDTTIAPQTMVVNSASEAGSSVAARELNLPTPS